jgi:hypothetical protein
MGIDDLAMIANAPVNPADVKDARDAEIGKAAAGATMPSPTHEREECEDTTAGRVARRGQNPVLHDATRRTDSERNA